MRTRRFDAVRSRAGARCRLNHLFLCREFPPAPYPPGGIGTYVRHITRLLADAGETVHVIAHRWAGAPRSREERIDGRLIVHRIALDPPIPADAADWQRDLLISRGLLASSFPSQAFAWHAARLAEQLIETAGIDVVEAQEWEAPLYYLQLRRRLSLGPERGPALVVHLHSSTEQIFAANHWDTTVADYAPAAAQEAFSIAAADALIAPSQFIARQALARHAVDPSRIHVIPYPIGDTVSLQRGENIWAGRSICHIGRLEPRKGVFECIDAIVAIAADYPDLRVDLVGGDTPIQVTGGPSVAAALRQRIPKPVRQQIRFHGGRDHAGVCEVLARASAVVVPSRWENFPYSCIEAMATGLPAVVSPDGGMRELVDDGVSGWIADSCTPAGLAAALRRALDTSGEQRQRMGQAALQSVNGKCANASIVRQHLTLKRGIAPRVQPPAVASTATGIAADRPQSSSRLAVVVLGAAGPAQLEGVRRGLRAQIESPARVIVECADLMPATVSRVQADGWEVAGGSDGGSGRRPSAATVACWRDQDLLGMVLVDARVQLDPDSLRICRIALERDDRLALLSAWTLDTAAPERAQVHADPGRPDRLDAATPAAIVAVKMGALLAIGDDPADLRAPTWNGVFERILRSDRSALVYPAILGSTAGVLGSLHAPQPAVRYSSMARAVQRLHTPLLHWLMAGPPEDRRQFVKDAVRSPLQSLRWLSRRALYALGQWPTWQRRAPVRAAETPPSTKPSR